MLADSLLDAMLSLNIEWVSVERYNLALPVKFGLLCAIAVLSQELCEMCGVGLSRRLFQVVPEWRKTKG